MGYLDDLIKNSKESSPEAYEKTFSEVKEMEVKPLEEQAINRILIKEYGRVKIYKYEGDPILHYEVPVPKMRGQERRIINTIKTLATKVITKSPDEFTSQKEAWDFYYNKIYEIIKAAAVKLNIPKAKYDFYAEWVTREMIGYGVLDILVEDDLLEEIMVNGPKRPVYVYHREMRMLKTNIIFESDEDIYAIIERIARQIGRRIDVQSPLLDATLKDGSRVNATIPPISIDGCTLTIRKFKKDPFTALDLIRFGTMSTEIAAFLWLAVEGVGGAKPANILIAGGTGSGKTSTLNVLASFIPATERVITVEDTPELQLPIEHVVRLLTRPPSIEGTGEVTMDMLVKNTLRMRPDRIIVGEVRHKEASTLFTAMNTGHDGCMGTIHANNTTETFVRVMSEPMNVPEIMVEALDLVIVQNRINDRRKGTIRRIVEIGELESVINKKPSTYLLYEWDAYSDTMHPTGMPSKFIQKVMKYTGLSKTDIEDEIENRKKFLESLLEKGGRMDIRQFKKELNNYEPLFKSK